MMDYLNDLLIKNLQILLCLRISSKLSTFKEKFSKDVQTKNHEFLDKKAFVRWNIYFENVLTKSDGIFKKKMYELLIKYSGFFPDFLTKKIFEFLFFFSNYIFYFLVKNREFLHLSILKALRN